MILSQPSWAAWIEIKAQVLPVLTYMSQPSWAAWIEILTFVRGQPISSVAALLGCVD